MDYPRISTNIKGLDPLMQGGILAGQIMLICGMAGSMKTSIAYNIAHFHAREGNGRSIYISLEQSRESLLLQMGRMGMDHKEVEEEFTIIDLGWLRMELHDEIAHDDVDWFKVIQAQIANFWMNTRFDLLVFDSMEAMFALSDIDDPRTEIYGFFEKLREMDITVFLVSEMQPDRVRFGNYGVEATLADGIIHLDMERSGHTVGRFISIVKMRETKHSADYYPLLFDATGFKIVRR